MQKRSMSLVESITNTAVGLIGGGGLDVSGSAMELVGNIFQGNTAQAGGGGAILWAGTKPTLRKACAPGWLLRSETCLSCAPGSFKETVTESDTDQIHPLLKEKSTAFNKFFDHYLQVIK